MHAIGEDTAERLDVIPAQFRVIVTHRPKYACRACEEAVVQAPAPERLIKGGLPTEAMVASVLVAKYAWHLPLYRQAQMLAAQGLDIKRSILAFWVGYAAAELKPIYLRLRELTACGSGYHHKRGHPTIPAARHRRFRTMKKCRLDMTIEKNDLDALELAIAQTLAEDDGRREQVDSMLEEDWWHGATFAAYHRQTDSLQLKPWESPPCCCDEDDIDDDADDIHGNKPALKLLQEMLDLGISRWHPDPLAAIEAAKRKHRKVS